MESMFLREVEQNLGSGPYAEGIKGLRVAGQMVPQIFHLFAFKTHATEHLAKFTQQIMRGPSPLSPGLRELIAAFTSSENHCPF